MLTPEQSAVAAKAKSFLPIVAPELLAAIFEPDTFDAVLLVLKQQNVESVGLPQTLDNIHKKWQQDGWLLVYVVKDNQPSEGFQKVNSSLARTGLLGSIRLERHIFSKNGWFETQFNIDVPDMFFIFHNGRPVYRSHYGYVITDVFGDRASEKSKSIEDISEKELQEIFSLIKKETLKFSHKRLLEMYVIYFMILKHHFVTEANEFLKNCVDFFLAQFRYAYGVSTKSWKAYQYPSKGPTVLRKLMRIGSDFGIPARFKGKISIEAWQNILFLRLFKQMRSDTEHRLQIHSFALRNTIYKGFISDTASDAKNLISQVTFIEYCFLLHRTKELLTDSGEILSTAKKNELGRLWRCFQPKDVDNFTLTTTPAIDAASHDFIPEMKSTLHDIYTLMREKNLSQ